MIKAEAPNPAMIRAAENTALTIKYAKANRISFIEARKQLEEFRDPKTHQLRLPPEYTHVSYGSGIDLVDLGGASEGSANNTTS